MADELYPYYEIPRRVGFLITPAERKRITELNKEKSQIFIAQNKILEQYEPLTTENAKAYSKAFNEFRQSGKYKHIFEINKELEEIANNADARYSQSFRNAEDFYTRVIACIKEFSLTLTPEQQAGFTIFGSGILPNKDNIKDKPPFINVSFSNIDSDEERYKMCYEFFWEFLDIQNFIAVANIRGWSIDPIIKELERKTEEYYKKPTKTVRPRRLGRDPKTRDNSLLLVVNNENNQGTLVNKSDFFNLPTSPASNLILEVMGAGLDVADLPARKKTVNHNSKLEVNTDGNKRQITQTNNKASITIEIGDIEQFKGGKNPAQKLFIQTLIKANEQAISNGQLVRDYVSFPLKELVDIGLYKDIRSARRGFLKGADALTSIKAKGHEQKNSKSTSAIDRLEVLFTGYKIENGQCYLRLNYAIDWSFLAQYFTILPKYFFMLSNRASDLLYYIFYIARQHTREIEEKGYFTLSFRAIQQRLNLPSETQTKNPQRDIRDEVEKALEQIEEEHRKEYKIKNIDELEFALTPLVDDTASISEYLEHGKLKIELKGKFAEDFIAISKSTAKQIESKKKRQEKIYEKAIALKMGMSLYEEDKKNSKK